MARKTFATPIEEAILTSFKKACKGKELRMNEVIEVLMKEFSDENIGITVKKNYIVKPIKSKSRAKERESSSEN